MTYVRVARLWTGAEWAGDALVVVDDLGIRPCADARSADAVLDATLLPPLTDAHVHIGLSDAPTHGGRRLARLLDLGWDRRPPSPSAVTEILWAGPFLTAPGGYPSTRPWAPEGSVRFLADADDAVRAVHEVHAMGAAVVKVTLNSDAGPVLSDESLSAAVRAAHGVGLRVVAHVEGAGQPQRAARAGVDCFAHTPWTQRLSDDELRAMVGTVDWISTLDMHGRGRYGRDYETAVENLRRFAAMGGNVIYGTDLGNAIETADLNPREIAALRQAGVHGERLLRALTGGGLVPTWSRTATLVPGHVADAEQAVAALGSAVPVDQAALLERVA